MKKYSIKKVLIPTDFSKTGLLAVEHAAFIARLYKADLYLLHVIEISESTFNIYNPAIYVPHPLEVEKIAQSRLTELAAKLKKEYAVNIKTLCTRGKVSEEIVTAVNDNKINLVVMGTHGARGFDELFIGSNAHKTITVCPCPVITIQTDAKKTGFTDIVLPIDNALHSREKVDYVIALAQNYAARIHILGLLDKKRGYDMDKFRIKLDAVEKAVKKAGLAFETKIIKGDNLAEAAMKYAKKIKADLIAVLTNHEARLHGIHLDGFSKQIVNHSKVPVLSIKPTQGYYDAVSLSAASPY